MYKGKKITCIAYGSKDYKKAVELNLQTALEHGADEVKAYGPKDLPLWFIIRNLIHFLRYPQCAYWVWKPYVILKALKGMREDEYLFYVDSAAVYINDVALLLDVFERDRLYIMAFNVDKIEKEYTKGDALFFLNADRPEIVNSNQRMSGFIVLKKCPETMKFVEKWLKACQNLLIVWGNRNFFKKNYPEYVANRNDQTAFSLLTKKAGIPAYRDPSQYGNGDSFYGDDVLKQSTFPEIWYLTRNPKITSMETVKNIMKTDPLIKKRTDD